MLDNIVNPVLRFSFLLIPKAISEYSYEFCKLESILIYEAQY